MWKQKKLQLIRASKKPACFNVNPIIIRMEIVLLMWYYVTYMMKRMILDILML